MLHLISKSLSLREAQRRAAQPDSALCILHSALFFLLLSTPCFAQSETSRLPLKPNSAWKRISRATDVTFLTSDEARRVADQVVLYQRSTGGWPKNIDFSLPLTASQKDSVAQEKRRTDDSTTDNNATTQEMSFLARMYNATGKEEYRDAVVRGVNYLLDGQYDNGGWPQFWPTMHGYQIHITYNDNAMVNTMRLLEKIRDKREPYAADFADKALTKRIKKALDKAVECILNTQITYKGELTVWCQQHDRETLAPAKARAYELPSFCSSESANIVSLLMDIKNPSERVKASIHAAMRWFDKYKIMGKTVRRTFDKEKGPNVELIDDPEAKTPLWARFYDLENCEPFVCDRDGIPRKRLDEIGVERRTGYGWYQDTPAFLFQKYEEWKKNNK